MNWPSRLLLPALYVSLVLTSCASQPRAVTRQPVTLHLVAADSCGPLTEELATAYEESHPWVTVESEVFNSSVAEQMLRSGQADLALLSWLRERDGEGGAALWSRAFARDGVAVIVHPDLPLNEAGLAQLGAIFRGRLQEWNDTLVTVVSREEGSGTRAAFEATVLGGGEPTLNAVVMPSSEAVVEYVAGAPSAIGYVSTRRLDESVRVLSVEGVLPNQETIENGSYPLSRSLYMVSLGEPTGPAREFAQWLLGPEGQAIANLGRAG